MKNLTRSLTLFTIAGFILTSCEGPMGPAGKDGLNGQAGKDANESCKLCHNSSVVETKAIEYEHAKHFTGVAFEEGARTGCAPCHSTQGFSFVVKNNTPVTFIADPNNAGKYLNNYAVDAATASLPGAISCFTCHSSLHTTYTDADFLPLATTAAVPMTMWGGSKTINFAQTDGNLCAKCHQPRPVTASSGNVIDYSLLVSAPTNSYTLSSLSYRTGIHYGAQGAMAAGVGGIEFGTGYTNSAHTTVASCKSCHMAAPTGLAGGHSFNVYDDYNSKVNFAGCNVTGCHSTMSATNATYTAAIADIATKLGDLATKINALGTVGDILQKDTVTTEYNGYFDIYDPSSNPTGKYKSGSTSSFTTDQKTHNNTLPAVTLTNAQFGAIMNFQLVLRGSGDGVHNYQYTKTLLENTLLAW